MPAPSWSAIASSTARSSAARNSSEPIVPASAASLASRRYSGRNRLPTTSALTAAVAVLVAIGASSRRFDVRARAYKVLGADAGRRRQGRLHHGRRERGRPRPGQGIRRRRHEGRDRRRTGRPPRGGDGCTRRRRPRDPAGRDRPGGIRTRGGRDGAGARQRARALQQRRGSTSSTTSPTRRTRTGTGCSASTSAASSTAS